MDLKIIKNRYTYLIVSGVFMFFSLLVLLFGNLNYGIDMTGGTSAEYHYSKNDIDLDEIRKNLKQEVKKITYNGKEVINGIDVYKISGQKELGIITGYNNIILTDNDKKLLSENNKLTKEKLTGEVLSKIKSDFREKTLNILKKYDSTIEQTNYTNIGKSFGDYIKNTAYLTLLIAVLAIAFYIMYAFSGVATGISTMSFAFITIITLFHDVLISTGLYIISSFFYPEFKIDTFFITALLTILGYSINDTIVVFDRIRFNIKKLIKKKKLKEIIEISVQETLRRSIFTSLTVFLVLLSVFIFGPEPIKGFILAMIFGTIVGTYSSIFIASPLLYEFNKHKKLSEYKPKIVRPEDKIVV